jgi:hypothetical protein
MAIISNGTTVVSGGGLSISVNPPTTSGAVGTYLFGFHDQNNQQIDGSTVSGNLYQANAGGLYGGSSRSGTWRVMGFKYSSGNADRCTLWVRIS